MSTPQLELFDAGPQLIRNPFCLYETQCGHKAELGPKKAWDGGFNRDVTCCHCKRVRGEISTRTDL
jgi:hypothetical protein